MSGNHKRKDEKMRVAWKYDAAKNLLFLLMYLEVKAARDLVVRRHSSFTLEEYALRFYHRSHE